jgi:hypothetical protein
MRVRNEDSCYEQLAMRPVCSTEMIIFQKRGDRTKSMSCNVKYSVKIDDDNIRNDGIRR